MRYQRHRGITARAIPKAPPHYQSRPHLEAELSSWLEDEDGAESMVLLGVLEESAAADAGPGLGTGASTLAAWAAAKARRVFEEGVMWLRLGPTPDLRRLQSSLAQALGFDERFASLAQGVQRLRDMFATRHLLLVLDDVTDIDHLAALDVLDARGRRLISTGASGLLDGWSADRPLRKLAVPPLSHEQARTLLLAWAGASTTGGSDQPSDQPVDQLVDQLVGRCERRPITLAIAGALAGHTSWTGVRALLARVESEEHLFSQVLPDAAMRILDAAYLNLRKVQRLHYRDLAVLPADEPVALAALAALWRREPAEVTAILEDLAARGLLLRGPDASFELHQMHRDYVRARADEPRERHDGMQAALQGLEAAETAEASTVTPATGELIDAYWIRRGPYYLRRGHRLARLRELLCDIGWLQAKVQVGGPMATAAEIERYLRAAGDDGSAGLTRLAETLRMASDILARTPTELPSQLLARLGGQPAENEALARLLADTAELDDRDWLRPLASTLAAPMGMAVCTILAHEQRITAVAASRWRGQPCVLSGSLDGTIAIWTLDGQWLHQLTDEGGGVHALWVDTQGSTLISGSEDGHIRLWDLPAGTVRTTLVGHAGPVGALACSADGTWLVSGSDDRTLMVWRLADGTPVHQLRGHSRAVTDVAVVSDGSHALSASEDGSVRVWDIVAGTKVARMWQRTRRARGVAWSPVAQLALAVSADGRLDLWPEVWRAGQPTGRPQPLATLRCLGGNGRAVAVTRDGRWAIGAGESAWLAVVDLSEAQVLGRLWSHSRGVNAVAVTDDGRHAVTSSDDQTIKVWHLFPRHAGARPPAHRGPVQQVHAHGAGEHVISVGADADLAIWRPGDGACLATCTGTTVRKPLAAFCDTGRYAIASAGDRALALWGVPTGERLGTLMGGSGSFLDVAVSPDGQHVVAGSLDGVVRMWSLVDIERPAASGDRPGARDDDWLRHTFTVDSSWHTRVAIVGGGRRVVAHTEGGLHIWCGDDGVEVGRIPRELSEAGAFAVSRDGRYALTSMASTIASCDLETGVVRHHMTGHNGPIVDIACTDALAVSLGNDGRLAVWDLESGQQRHTLKGDAFGIRALLGVTGNGLRALSQSRSGVIEVWDLQAGTRLHALPHRAKLLSFACQPDGTRAWTAARDGRLIEWDLDAGREVAAFSCDGRMRACAVVPGGDVVIAGDSRGRVHLLRCVRAS